jgi:hypothetical protein
MTVGRDFTRSHPTPLLFHLRCSANMTDVRVVCWCPFVDPTLLALVDPLWRFSVYRASHDAPSAYSSPSLERGFHLWEEDIRQAQYDGHAFPESSQELYSSPVTMKELYLHPPSPDTSVNSDHLEESHSPLSDFDNSMIFASPSQKTYVASICGLYFC